MNEEQMQKSERIASALMRALAIIGLVAVLALIAWFTVLAVRGMSGGGISAAVNYISSLWSTAPKDTLQFNLDTRTLTSSEPFMLNWSYTGTSDEQFRLSYACANDVTLAIKRSGAWDTLACGTEFTTTDSAVLILPTSTTTRLADVTLTIVRGSLEDSTTVTVVNTHVSGSPDANEAATTTTKTTVAAPAPTPVAPATPVVKPSVKPQTPVSTVVPVARPATPADLAVDIVETGVLMKSGGKTSFFPVSPIPTDKTAAVRFTVTNRGGKSSDSWAFIARLPIEGDSSYRYTSPIQASLAPGMQVEFTLGFDELLNAKSGTITVQVVPGDDTDALANNTDSVKVTIREK